ncbi:MAG: M1 family aminopeptidase [Acidobacteriota bacterium]
MRKTTPLLILTAVFVLTGSVALGGEPEIDRLANLKTIRYDLNIKVDYEAEKIFGQCRMVIQNPGPSVFSTIPLLLYRLLKVASIADSRGETLPFTQEVTAFDDWEKLQVNYIRVTLKTPLRGGEKETLAVDYQGYILGYAETGMAYVRETIDKDFTILRPDGRAYPEVGLPSWKAFRRMGLQNYRYCLNVTVPDSLTVANGGRLVGVSTANGWSTYSYENIKPAWRMDASIATYSILEEDGGLLKVFHFKEDAAGAATILATLKSTIDLYSKWFGPPEKIEGFAVIEVPDGFGSQADVTSILQTRAAFQKQDQMYQFFHEVSHIFDVRCIDSFPARFESEGMATFLQYLVQEKKEGRAGSLKNGLDRVLGRLKKEFTDDPKKIAVPMADYGKEDMTDLSYTKGMVFFALLHELLGEEKFFGTMGSFYRKFRRTGATTADFVNHLKAESGLDLGRFLEDWVNGTQSNQWIAAGLTFEDLLKKYMAAR